jgi:hypothetical protein
MVGALKVAVLVVVGVIAAKWLSHEEYGEKRVQRIIREYSTEKASQLLHR